MDTRLEKISDLIPGIADRILDRCDQLATCSEHSTQLTRTFCCEPMKQVHRRLQDWMQAIGIPCRVDALGNLIGRRSSSGGDHRVFMMGSHLDSVVDAGKYDGPLGVLLAVGVAELLHAANIALPFSLDIVGFSEEEGVRFNSPFLGSRAIAGEFSEELLRLKDPVGITVEAALESFGADSTAWSEAEYAVDSLVGFLEAHIEQGPVLESQNLPVGIVSAIAGQTRSTFEFLGLAGHAGTVPHELRRDALAAAAEFIIAVEDIGRRTEGLFATVGDVQPQPNVSNVISGCTIARLDLRHADDQVREQAYEQIKQSASDIAERRGLVQSVVAEERQPAVRMDRRLESHLSAAIASTGHRPFTMVSGAGHDAVMLARKTASSMLFVRCRGGVSHNPSESVEVGDIQVALEVMLRFVLELE